MAKQKGLIKLSGTIGDISFYQTKDGYFARTKGGIEKARIENDPALIRVRENNREFGTIGKAGKLFRDAMRSLTQNIANSGLTSRIVKIMAGVKNLDTVSVRGRRNVAVGIESGPGKALLKGFNFNLESNLSSILFRPVQLSTVDGSIAIEELTPLSDLETPSAATHVRFTAAWTRINFEAGAYDTKLSESDMLSINGTTADLLVTPPDTPDVTGTNFHLLLVEFFQEVNGVYYPLKSGAHNALSILEVV